MSTDLFVSGFLLSLTVCLDLGTVNLILLRTGLQRGPVPAFWLGVGSCVGDLVYAGLSAVAISLILQFAPVRWALWLGGSGFMLFLAVRMVRESMGQLKAPILAGAELVQPAALGPAETLQHMLRGMGLALSSPSAILWFATVGGSVIATQLATQSLNPAARVPALLTFFTGFFLAGIAWSVLIALVAGQGRKMMGPQLTRGLALASAVMFAYFAVKIFVDGYGTFVMKP